MAVQSFGIGFMIFSGTMGRRARVPASQADQRAFIQCLIDVSDALVILTRVLFQSVAERGTYHIARATRWIIALMAIRHLANPFA